MSAPAASLTGTARLLVVEDVLETVQATLMVLEENGWVYKVARDISAAESELKYGEWTFLLLDWRLPDHHGVLVDDAGAELLRSLKLGEYGPVNQHIPFAILTTQGIFIPESAYRSFQGFQGIFYKVDDIRMRVRTVDQFRDPDSSPLPAPQAPDESRWQALVEVVGTEGEGDEERVRLVVPGWDPDWTCTVPMSALPDTLASVVRNSLPSSTYLLAEANLAAESEDELGLSDFTLAPAPAMPDEEDRA